MKRDLYQTITDQLVAKMQTGVMPWEKSWSSGGAIPVNATTERPYSGINVLLFWMAQDAGYAKPRYLTFKQAKAAGGSVRAGEKGTTVYYFKPLVVKDKVSGEDKKVPLIRQYTVFNVAQCTGLPEGIVEGPAAAIRNQDQREQDADSFIKTTGADFREGVGEPYYIPSKDFISMPAFKSFASKEEFYATAFHELVHWTGAKGRLARDMKPRFDTHAYALEELVAEIGAAFLCAEFGFNVLSRSASYLDSWLQACKEHPKAIFTAASQASKAAEYLRGLALAEGQALAA